MNFQQWLNNNLGHERLNPDPPRGLVGQCVYEASSWSMAQGGPELFPGETAYAIWLNFNHPFYQRVTSGYLPGDILFFRPNDPNVGTGPAGHVDVYVGANTTADDDWNGSHDVQLVNLNLARFAVGAFRPVGGGPNMDLADVRLRLLNQLRDKLGVQIGDVDAINIINLLAAIDDKNKALDYRQGELDSLAQIAHTPTPVDGNNIQQLKDALTAGGGGGQVLTPGKYIVK